ncbi:hypothetical protein HDV05_003179, partial [Chytridiales sp. JEL 0842]
GKADADFGVGVGVLWRPGGPRGWGARNQTKEINGAKGGVGVLRYVLPSIEGPARKVETVEGEGLKVLYTPNQFKELVESRMPLESEEVLQWGSPTSFKPSFLSTNSAHVKEGIHTPLRGLHFKSVNLHSSHQFPASRKVDQTLIISASQSLNNSTGKLEWLINKKPSTLHFLRPPSPFSASQNDKTEEKPLLARLSEFNSTPPWELPYIPLQKGSLVDVILQNTRSSSGLCEAHTWHLHGHTFWDLGGGPGTYSLAHFKEHDQKFEVGRWSVRRDTVTVYPYSHTPFEGNGEDGGKGRGEDCGWAKIR